MLTGLIAALAATPHPAIPQQAMAFVALTETPELRAPEEPEGVPYYLYVPSRLDPSARPLVAVHGISRRADEHLAAFAPWAEASGRLLIAPLFSKERCRRYQKLVIGSCRADRALLATLRTVAEATGQPIERVDLFGFSGGAQFAHRFAMMYPEQVGRLAVSSAGWYTLPDLLEAYPYALARADGSAARFKPDLDRFLAIPTLVMVGERDVRRDPALRRDANVDRRQGLTRVERAARWSQSLRRAADARGIAAEVAFEVLDGCGHSFADCVRDGGLTERAARWFEGS